MADEEANVETMTDEMSAVFDRMEAEDTPTETTDGPSRDEQGRFAVKDEPEAPAEAAEASETPAETPVEETTDQPAEAEPEPEQAHAAPASWSASAKEHWASLDPAIQAEVLKRESDIQRGLADSAEKLKSYQPLEQALEPARAWMAMNGVNPAQLINQLSEAHMMLANPQTQQQAIQWLMQSYRIDPSAIGAEPGETELVDPEIAALKQELSDLKAQSQQQLTQWQIAQQNAAQAQIDAFKQDHPNFDALEPKMTLLARGYLQANEPVPDLKSLYDEASWAVPEVRETLIVQQREAADAQRKAELAKRAEEAKQASEVNLSSKGTAGGETPKAETEREMMERVYDERNA